MINDIENKKIVASNFVSALNAVSMSLKDMYALEDIIENGHFDLALDYVKNNDSSIRLNDKISLIYLFETMQ